MMIKEIDANDLQNRIAEGDEFTLLDIRSAGELAQGVLPDAEHLPMHLIPLRINELPKDKDAEIICFCKISLRGYETALILEENGWTNVKVMEGGIVAWPYAREK